jgi:hypothetical protein
VEQVRAAAARLAAGGLDPDVVFPPAPEGAFRGRLIAYKPVQESNELDLMFPLWPMQSPDMRRVPGAGFLTSLLGDESTGGLLPLLRSRGLAEGVSAGLELDTSGFALLQLSVSLSPLAMLNITAAGEAAEAALSGVKPLAWKYCGGGHGGYALYLCATQADRERLCGFPGFRAIEPYLACAGS